MWNIVARAVNFGMADTYMIMTWDEQRAIETVVGMDIYHSDICLNAPYNYSLLFMFVSTEIIVVRLGATLGRCLKSAPDSIPRAGIDSTGPSKS